MSQFAVGSLVQARGREWVVLPDSDPELLVVRPLGGGDDEIAGILTGIEPVSQAAFPPPQSPDAGNAVSAGLLRTALQIGFRSTAGPFRSLAGLAVEPRPYQLVPLLMALRQETARLLIADDVGIGKTIEAALIAAELLAQGSASRLAVLCSPALAEQWQGELAGKFRIDAELVLSSTVKKLERGLFDDEWIFDRYPYTVVSTDFIKSPRHRDLFIQGCPDLVIVDEAHGCVADGSSGRDRTLRYDLMRRLAADVRRHLLLVTATPHSGKEEGFRNLIALLDPELANLDLSVAKGRERLARHMVQRRRSHIRKFLEQETAFPSDRLTQEQRYYLTDGYRKLFDSVLSYAREAVRDSAGGPLRQRVRYWSALALLRALASSPKAAAATLRTRARNVDAATVEEADTLGRATVLDLAEAEAADALDVVPGADDIPDGASPERRRLLELARRADQLAGEPDAKLAMLDSVVQGLLAEGDDPVVFCRFIDTAEYVTEHLRISLGRSATVECVTGTLPPADREARIAELTDAEGRHVLIATDCLSEGVNLQQHFQAVVHYDLAWNPTRHEQREGRVDRFGQPRDVVRAVTIIGADNQIDEIVMRVLLRKHEAIRRQLGISVPVPDSANYVVEAVLEELLARPQADQPMLAGMDELIRTRRADLHREWDSFAERENAALTKFAQTGIKPDEVARELAEIRASLGAGPQVEEFTREALDALGASLGGRGDGFDAVTATLPQALRGALPPGHAQPLPFHRELPVPRRHAHLDRTDPSVRAVARYVLESALEPKTPGPRPARRCGVLRTAAVARRTTLLLVRFRLHLTLPGREGPRAMVAEEARVLAYRGRPTDPSWLDPDEVDALLAAEPTGNVAPELAHDDLERIIDALVVLQPHIDAEADAVAQRLRESHSRVREATRRSGTSKIMVAAHRPSDVLGIYLYLPTVPAGVTVAGVR
ncbi:MAG TPA: helicase-related protein [Pseudonocardiaceae bacterium]